MTIAWNSSIGFTGISDEDFALWAKAYPACDLDRQVSAAHDWMLSNPSKRKKNYRRFLTNWLSRAQEKGGDIASNRLSDGDSAIAVRKSEARERAHERQVQGFRDAEKSAATPEEKAEVFRKWRENK